MKNRNHVIDSVDTEKMFDHIQHPFMIKTPNTLRTEENYLNMLIAIYEKPTANLILNDERLTAFHLRSLIRQDAHLATSIQHHTRSSSHSR